MRPPTRKLDFLLALASILVSTPVALAVADDVCVSCHSTQDALADAGERAARLVVDEKSLAGSIHDGFSCTQCHADLAADDAPIPHPAQLAPADCSQCHADTVEHFKSASIHATQMKLTAGAKSPCSACHGSHQIRPKSDPESPTHRHGVADLCARCHGASGDGEKDNVVELWKNSVHGHSILDWEIEEAPTCVTCHNAHETRRLEDPAAPLNRRNSMYVCGKCHESELKTVLRGVHGKAWQAGRLAAPACIDCHGSHDIQRPRDRGSRVYAGQVSLTCGRCHDDPDLTTRFALRPDRVSTYDNSFHGRGAAWKDAAVANCASCHRYHDVRAGADPASPVNPKNLQAMCGRPDCHPGATRQFAALPVHAGARSTGQGFLRLLRVSYVLIISFTLAFMAAHQTIDFIAVFRERRRRRAGAPEAHPDASPPRALLVPPLSEVSRVSGRWVIQRWNFNMVVQHFALAVSFTALCVTGFALSMPAAWASRLGPLGPPLFSTRGILHRIFAVVMIAGSVYHMYWLLRDRRGRRELVEMLPRPLDDGRHMLNSVLWFVGLRERPPAGARYTYREKAEYWALVWGTIVMIATGFVLWTEAWWPWIVVESSRIVHSYEAILAFGAIIVWHMFSVHLRPGVFPNSPTWIDGTAPAHVMHEEHAQEYQEMVAWYGVDPAADHHGPDSGDDGKKA